MCEDRFRAGPTNLLSSLFLLAVAFLPVAFVLLTAEHAAAMPPVRLGARVGWVNTDEVQEEAASVGVDAGAFVLQRLSLDLRADYAVGIVTAARHDRIYTDVGVTLHDSSRTAFVSAFGGLAFRNDERAPSDPIHDNDVAPEVGMSFGRLIPLGAGAAVGPSITVAFGEVEGYPQGHVGATRYALAIGGTLDVGMPKEDPETKEPLGVSAAGRVFIAGALGMGAEIGYALLPQLELGAQWLRRVRLGGTEYCDRCVIEDDRFAAYVEGRLPVLPYVAPYARLSAGAGKLKLTGSEPPGGAQGTDGTFANVGGELGVELHGAGVSVRAFALVLATPAVEDSTALGGGLQLGTRL